jgi:hypothetical protein
MLLVAGKLSSGGLTFRRGILALNGERAQTNREEGRYDEK